MNREEWEHMVDDMVEDLNSQIYSAAERNRYKDQWGSHLEKGWEGFDLRPKLLEEFKEVVENPCSREIGDLAWVLAMMLDQERGKVNTT